MELLAPAMVNAPYSADKMVGNKTNVEDNALEGLSDVNVHPISVAVKEQFANPNAKEETGAAEGSDGIKLARVPDPIRLDKVDEQRKGTAEETSVLSTKLYDNLPVKDKEALRAEVREFCCDAMKEINSRRRSERPERRSSGRRRSRGKSEEARRRSRFKTGDNATEGFRLKGPKKEFLFAPQT